MNKLFLYFSLIGFSWLISSLLLPTLGVAQTCSPPVYNYSPVYENQHETRCINPGEAGERKRIWYATLNKQAGMGGRFKFTVTIPASANTPEVREGTKLVFYAGNRNRDIAFIYTPGSTDNIRNYEFNITADDETSLLAELYLEYDTGRGPCDTQWSPDFSVSNIAFIPAIRNVSTVTNYSETAHENAHDTGCIGPTSAGWNGRSFLLRMTLNKLAGEGGNLSFTIVEPARTNPPDIRTGTKIAIYQDGSTVPTGRHSLINQPASGTSADVRYPILPIYSTNATTVTVDFYLETEGGDNCDAQRSPEFTISDIKFTTLGPPRLATPQVADVALCQPGIAHLVVNNPLSQTEYYWFTSANATTEVHRGTTYDFSMTGNTRVYVQAVPTGNVLECSSLRKEVNVTISTNLLATPQVADVELCQAGTAHLVVNNPLSQTDYYWFTDANATTEAARGTTYDFSMTGNTRVYVQAVPNGRAECPSTRKEVNVSISTNRLPTPQVDDAELCRAGTAHLVVNNPLSQTDYYWFTDANATTEAARGTTYDFAVTGNTRVYVQAVPNGRAECSSPRKEVAITVHNPSVAFAINTTVSGPTPYLQNYTLGFTATTGYDSYTWNWGDDTAPQVLTTAASTHAYARPGTYTITLTAYKAYPRVAGGGCSVTTSVSGVVVIAPLCEIQALSGGKVQQNTRSGALSYVAAADRCVPAVSFECISDLSTIIEEPALKKVVSATATAFADQLVPPTTQNANPYLAGQWRTTPQASYSFRTSLTPDANPQNYSFGTFALLPFDWESSLRARPAAWLTAAIAEQVAPNGDVLQERDPLGIPSAAKFGYGSTDVYRDPRVKHASRLLPYLQAHNADYQSVLFESFESIYAGATRTGEDNLPLPDDVQLVTCDIRDATSTSCFAHTGNTCALLTNRQLNLLPITLTPQLFEQGLLIKVWVRVENYNPVMQTGYIDGLKADGTLLGSVSLMSNTALPSVVQNGSWLLFETQIRNFGGMALGDKITPRLRFESSVGNVWVDDIRMQPAQAQMTTYVYDPVSLRLLASFDDQHFALRYQYNAEGKLIRKQAETVQGLKTLQETHYHTPASNQVND